MNWSTELLDENEALFNYTALGLDFCEKFSQFIKDRASIEQDYAAKIKKLIAKHTVPPKKFDELCPFSFQKSFQQQLKELTDSATQHELLADELNGELSSSLNQLITFVKGERKKIFFEWKASRDKYDNALKMHNQAKNQYRKAHLDSQKAEDWYKKADQDSNMTKAEVEKRKFEMEMRSREREKAKQDYAAQLSATNTEQTRFYTQLSPQCLNNLQQLEIKRIMEMARFFEAANKHERQALHIIGKCCDGVDAAIRLIEAQKDIDEVVIRNKRTFQPPEDLPFEDLSAPSLSGPNANGGSTSNLRPPPLLKITKRKDEPREDFSHLAPLQQKRCLEAEIDKLKELQAKKQKSIDGMRKLYDTYSANPAFQKNQADIQKEMQVAQTELNQIAGNLAKFQGFLVNAEERIRGGSATKSFYGGGGPSDTDGLVTGVVARPKNEPAVPGTGARQSTVTQRLSVTSQPSAVSLAPKPPQPQPQPQPPQPQVTQSTTKVNLSPGNRAQQHALSPTHAEQPDEFGEEEPLPAIGSAKMLYEYKSTDESAISVPAGEVVEILANDEGGWTQVRRTRVRPSVEGFVPTSYLTRV